MLNEKVTLGSVWQDNVTGKVFEVLAVNGIVQLGTIGKEQSHIFVSPDNLRRCYKLLALSVTNYTKEHPVEVELDAVSAKIDVREKAIVKETLRESGKALVINSTGEMTTTIYSVGGGKSLSDTIRTSITESKRLARKQQRQLRSR
jgi:hypothetical protein